ncbi:unnamed protein product [Caenorhabditis bovis]|uniref:Pepsin inhibitor-3-like repeated domain-containing protein n=1 Tax=Caenorhabditis bovis TaxID=2654633 RepID=A0A8S1EWL0_9PELO|nr:unnamed protein product [Caenorhabditis bovis]
MLKLAAIIFAIVAVVAMAAPRDKRQLAVGTISVSGAGGSTGCVVTGNILYANGIRLRELTAAEQTELDNYQNSLEQYKEQLREILNQRRENLRTRMTGQGNEVNETENLPKAPVKPSFCSADETTQYYFDGCMVQNNKVYVGGQYARDLSSDEISELKVFDEQQTAYQKAIHDQMQNHVRGLFGGSDILSALFGEDAPGRQSAPATTQAPGVTTTMPPKPKVPQFCTAIY